MVRWWEHNQECNLQAVISPLQLNPHMCDNPAFLISLSVVGKPGDALISYTIEARNRLNLLRRLFFTERRRQLGWIYCHRRLSWL